MEQALILRPYSRPDILEWLSRLGRAIFAITQEVCNSFKTEVLTGVHNFTASTGDTFKLALYTSSATLNKSTTVYAATNEVPDSGSYAAGGGSLTSVTPVLSTDTAVCDFNDLTFTSATITARGALIYNSSKSGKACFVLNFTTDKSSSNGNFLITFPAAAAGTAIYGLS